MIVSRAKLISAFEKAKAIKEHKTLFCLDPHRIPVSVEDVHWVVQDMTGVEIEKVEVRTTSEVVHVRAFVERFKNNKARIIVLSGQPESDKRYACIKELSHIAVDEVEDFSAFGDRTIEKLINERMIEKMLRDGNGSEQVVPKMADNEVQSEEIAEIIANEIIYPHEYRSTDAGLLKNGAATHASLALHYKVPEFVIQRVHSPGYSKLTRALWQEVNKQRG